MKEEERRSFIQIARRATELKSMSAINQERLKELKENIELYKKKNDLVSVAALNYLTAELNDCENALAESLKYYYQLNFPITAETLHQHGFDDWLRIEKLGRYFGPQDKAEYETFVLGYLYYYEQYELSNEEKEKRKYKLYFDWGETSHGKFDLIIYITPLYKKIYSYELISAGSNENTLKSPLAPPPTAPNDPQPPPPPPPPPRGTKTQ